VTAADAGRQGGADVSEPHSDRIEPTSPITRTTTGAEPNTLTPADRDARKRAARTRKLAAAEHKLKVFALRRAGASYAEIAASLGISKTRAHQIVAEELDRLNALLAESVEQHRALELARLDKLLARLDTRTRTSVPAVFAYVKCLERRAKLLGLDRPLKLAIESPSPEKELPDDALDREIERLQQQLATDESKKLRLVKRATA
jgi:hypothetical protein